MDDLLAAALTDRGAPLPGERSWPALLEAAADHGVLPLLSLSARRLGWPEALARRLRDAAAADAAIALAQQHELRRVLDLLHAGGTCALPIKGAHLSVTHYASPGLRPRRDTDLLVPGQDRQRVRALLLGAGYAPIPHVTGAVAFSQFQMWRTDAAGVRHTLDVHWRLATPRAFADRLAWSEVEAASLPAPALGPDARVPSPAHALIAACIHRTAHHANSERLIWLYDIRVLAASLSQGEWSVVAKTSARTGLASVVMSGLTASTRLGASIPAEVSVSLEAASTHVDADVDAFVGGRIGRFGIAASDLRRLPWRERATFVREHLLPSPDYMAGKYGVRTRAALPFLYVHRAVTGWRRWLTE